MATLPWLTLASTLWPLRADKSADPGGGLFGRINAEAVRLLAGVATAGEAEQIATAQIQRMTNFYRQKLILRFSQVYPDTLPSFQKAYERRKQATTEFSDYCNSVAGVGDVVPAATLSFGNVAAMGASMIVPVGGIFGYTVALKPALYFFDSSSTVIDSNLLKDTANPGDYAGDVSVSASIGLYCNHGTKATPVWVNADSNTLPDFISNPSEIRECGYLRAISYIKSYATDVNDGQFEYRQSEMPVAAKSKRDEATEAENVAFALLQIDRSGNGIISDFDRDAARVRKWFF